MEFLIYPAAFIFILGSAVVLHEFGHFIVAKLFRIRVETFSVGFGPRLFGRKWGHTDYRVSAIPLGGYVKLGGDESNAPLEGASAHEITEGLGRMQALDGVLAASLVYQHNEGAAAMDEEMDVEDHPQAIR